MNQALKLLILETIDVVYIDERRDKYTAFLNVSSRDLMNLSLQKNYRNRHEGKQTKDGRTN